MGNAESRALYGPVPPAFASRLRGGKQLCTFSDGAGLFPAQHLFDIIRQFSQNILQSGIKSTHYFSG